MKLIVTDHGDPSAGIQPIDYSIEAPFSEIMPIDNEMLDQFKSSIALAFSEFTFGWVSATYVFDSNKTQEQHMQSIYKQFPEFKP